jgi:hypothetical protein
MKCCYTCYSICEPLISCFETLLVYLPIGYAEETVKIRISNGQNYVTYQTADVVAGTHVSIDLIPSEIPVGFFSAFGGPYQIEFFGTDLNQLQFVAIDGKTYNCITFQVVNGSTDETVAFVNAFYNEIPGGY